MPRMRAPATRTIALATAIAAGLALAIAMVSEQWEDLAPCALCLWERWPYRVIAVLGLVAVVLPRHPARILLWLAVLTALAGAAAGVVHVGVEQHLWPSPLPECAAPTFSGGSIADMLKAMPAQPTKPCDSPSYLLPGVPLSLATMNLICAASLAVVLAGVLWRTGRD